MDEQEKNTLPSEEQPAPQTAPEVPAQPTPQAEPAAPAPAEQQVTPAAPATPVPPFAGTTTPTYPGYYGGYGRPTGQAPQSYYAQQAAGSTSQFPPRETARSGFSEHPGGNWVRPIEPMTTAGTPAPAYVKPRRTASTASPRLIALLLCLCVLFSGASGFIGILIGRAIPQNSTPSTTVLWETAPSTPIPSGSSDGDALIAAVASARKSVVEITTETIVSGSFFGQSVQSGAGSGVIVTNDGYIVTNDHVIDGASTITVRLESGESYEATLRGTDPDTDLAVLKINVTSPLIPAQWGRSDELQPGQRVFAIGNPLGTLGGSVSDGIISALDREISVGGIPMTLLQTNAAVNPGNSGGGLFNLAGQLIGIVNAKYTDESLEGLGFAIPQKVATLIVSDLIAQGYVTGRPQIGVELLNVTTGNIREIYADSKYSVLTPYISGLRQYGIYVYKTDNATVVSGSLLQGDLLLAVDGTAISSFTDIQAVLRKHKVGDDIVLKVLRLTASSDNSTTTSEVEVTVRLTQKTVTVPVS